VSATNAPDAQPGARNGYRPATVKTTAGPVTLERPKLRGTTAAFASRLFGKQVTKTNALESLVIASFVRGLSVRNVEATLADALGDQAAISKSTVSLVCQAKGTEYNTWARRPLGDVVLDYLFLDASFFRMHPGLAGRADPGRVGHHHRGQTRLRWPGPRRGRVHRRPDRFPDRPHRPWAGMSAAGRLRRCSRPDRCDRADLPDRVTTTLRDSPDNVLAKIPAGMQAEIRDGYWAVFDTADLKTEPGPRLVELIELCQHRLGRARPRIPRLARTCHDPRRATPAPRPAPQPAATTPATPAPGHRGLRRQHHRNHQRHRAASHPEARTLAGRFTLDSGRYPA